MLTASPTPCAAQRGAILFVTLVVLVVTTLAGIALVRSMDTGTTIAGNLEFQQATAMSSEAGLRAAHNWLASSLTANPASLTADQLGNGYWAIKQNPAATQSWEAFWTASLAANAVSLATDSAGNTVRYVIHRLCDSNGANPPVCARPPSGPPRSSMGGGSALDDSDNSQFYYRITIRIEGPRNTVNYVQATIAI